MRNPLRLAVVCFLLSSCASLQPYISDELDPFTKVRKQSMWVSSSSSAILLEAMYPNSPSMRIVPINHYLTIKMEGSDTLLYVARFYPERGYDVPSDSRLLIKFFDRDDNGPILNLPLLTGYHTTGGPLLVKARIGRDAIRLLQREELDYIRIEKVATNEAEFHDIDWRTGFEYAKAFRKGSVMLFERRKEPGSRRR